MMMKFLTLPVCALALAGCVAHAAPALAPALAAQSDPNAHGTACVAQGGWYTPRDRQVLAPNQALVWLRDKDVVLLGESHVFADHHRWQLQTLSQLYAQRPDMILGFESFPRRVQGVLNQWVAGNLTPKEFLAQTDWDEVWKYDADLYMPLFEFARLNRIPMVALNVERSLPRNVGEKGWANIPDAQREGLSSPAPAADGYLKMLGGVFSQHGEQRDADTPPSLDDPQFAGFVNAQLTWDRAMAEATANALRAGRKEGRDPRVVSIIGHGHLDHFYGVPHQLEDLGVDDVAVLMPWDNMRPCADLVLDDATPVADMVFGIADAREDAAPEKPKLGVMIQSGETGVHIGDVVAGSIAEAAGLQKDDEITIAAGTPVSKPGDLVAIIQAVAPGTWLPLTVQRDGKAIDIVARFPANDQARDD